MTPRKRDAALLNALLPYTVIHFYNGNALAQQESFITEKQNYDYYVTKFPAHTSEICLKRMQMINLKRNKYREISRKSP